MQIELQLEHAFGENVIKGKHYGNTVLGNILHVFHKN
jgi:hypothetical protein